MKSRIKYSVILIFLMSFSAGFLFAQETENPLEVNESAVQENFPAADEINDTLESVSETHKKGFFDIFSFCAGFTPSVMINTQENSASAPSPFFYPIYLGIAFPQDLFISVQPSLKFFTTYNLVTDKGVVVPSEIENRTALTLSFLIDIPVLFRIDFFHKVDFRASAGIGALIRYAILASGIKDSDYGYTGTAAGDVAYMNEWFYSNLRFLYLSGGVSVLFKYERLKFGPEFSIYFPFSVVTDFTMDAMIISAGLKLVF